MNKLDEGHYYRKQLGCRCGVIAWSHNARFRKALRLLGPHAGRLLDYGCGDGTFLAMAASQIQSGDGADISADQIAACRRRFADTTNLRFFHVSELIGSDFEHQYDVVTCMETLEHCLDATVDVVLADLARLVTTTGRVIISVPIEIGPTFFFKTAIRKFAGRTIQPEYRHYESYTFADTLRMVFATKHTQLQRHVHGLPDTPFHNHYGFNWRHLRARLGRYFTVERTTFSPLGFLGGFFSSQAWLICRPLDSHRA